MMQKYDDHSWQAGLDFTVWEGSYEDSTEGKHFSNRLKLSCPMALNHFYIHPYIDLFVGNAKTTKFLFALFLGIKLFCGQRHLRPLGTHAADEEGLFT